MNQVRLDRRGFLGATALGLSAGVRAAIADDDGRPPVLDPRATDGDEKFEPRWDERLTLTVGPEGKDADLAGRDDKVIQAALGHVARLGGGTVQLLPGTYTLRNAVFLPSRVRLVGSGADTILTKIPTKTVTLVADSDWYDREITLEDARGFKVGDGIVIRTIDPTVVIKRTLVGRSGNRFLLDSGLRKNIWLDAKPTCASQFPLLTASERTSDVIVENLTLDGDKANNVRLDGNYAGCVFIQDCTRFTFRALTARHYHGDGISFQVCHDVTVEHCHSHDNADLGIHPGSGSQRPLIRNNRLERNSIGLFWCWGVKYGLAERNRIEANRDYGVSIGHNDTDNLIRDNDIRTSGKVGILFRNETSGHDFLPNRNRVESNRVTDSGGDDAPAIDIQGATHDLRITGNVLRETRAPARRVGIRISSQAREIALSENRFDGFSKEVLDLRDSS